MVWCGVSAERVLTLYFFEDELENTIIITGEKLSGCAKHFVCPEVENTRSMMAASWGYCPYSLSGDGALEVNVWKEDNFKKL